MKDNKYLGSWDLEVNGKYEPKVVTYLSERWARRTRSSLS